MLGVGGAAIVASLITGGVALDQSNQLATRCTDFVCDPSDAALIESADTLSITTDVLFFTGLGVAALGVVLALVLDQNETAPAAGAFCTSDGCSVSVAQRF